MNAGEPASLPAGAERLALVRDGIVDTAAPVLGSAAWRGFAAILWAASPPRRLEVEQRRAVHAVEARRRP